MGAQHRLHPAQDFRRPPHPLRFFPPRHGTATPARREGEPQHAAPLPGAGPPSGARQAAVPPGTEAPPRPSGDSMKLQNHPGPTPGHDAPSPPPSPFGEPWRAAQPPLGTRQQPPRSTPDTSSGSPSTWALFTAMAPRVRRELSVSRAPHAAASAAAIFSPARTSRAGRRLALRLRTAPPGRAGRAGRASAPALGQGGAGGRGRRRRAGGRAQRGGRAAGARRRLWRLLGAPRSGGHPWSRLSGDGAGQLGREGERGCRESSLSARKGGGIAARWAALRPPWGGLRLKQWRESGPTLLGLWPRSLWLSSEEPERGSAAGPVLLG